MYISTDSNTIIYTKDIIGIFNINNINKKTEESFFNWLTYNIIVFININLLY